VKTIDDLGERRFSLVVAGSGREAGGQRDCTRIFIVNPVQKFRDVKTRSIRCVDI
jgi:hypothetical protein